ncbi:MAG: hypothetical protein ACOZIN_09360 [Myxococcota bacterium]
MGVVEKVLRRVVKQLAKDPGRGLPRFARFFFLTTDSDLVSIRVGPHWRRALELAVPLPART